MTALVVVSPTSIDFGRVMVNSTSSQSVTVQNTGTASVTLSQATVVGTGFSISGLSLPVSLATGQGTSFTVIFAPTAMGSATGSITLVSNARNSPTSVALDGAGRDAFSGW
jgi:subtilase family serine protease